MSTVTFYQSLLHIANDMSSEWKVNVHNMCAHIDFTLWNSHKPHVSSFVHALTDEMIEKASRNHLIQNMMNEIMQSKCNDASKQQAYMAYLSLEYGISQIFHQYAGGLGILAGDHLKSASDLCIPIIGVGLLYREGSPHQHIDESGAQQDYWTMLKDDLPISLIKDNEGNPVMITVDFPEGIAHVQLHEICIGAVRLILLDTYHEKNVIHPILQSITNRLYFGDRAHRLRQELLIGIGGIKALHALGYEYSYLHVNEGHCAFAMTQWIHMQMKQCDLSFHESLQQLSSSMLFTTHTPVDAGNEVFSQDLIKKLCIHHRQDLGLSESEFLKLGSAYTPDDVFSLSAMAITLAGSSNAVSTLHGSTAGNMWKHLEAMKHYNGKSMASITNGIHVPSWVGPEIAAMLDKHIGRTWRTHSHDEHVWQGVQHIPRSQIRASHEKQKTSMIEYLQTRMSGHAKEVFTNMNAQTFTIGYARRFASYKRALLLFSDGRRLQSIINDSAFPVKIIIAGKAHPDDIEAKEVIKKIHQHIKALHLQSSICVLEDYDIALAKAMVQGCDLWLNTPRRPMEACGTSGMKAAVNGCLHCSISDGWWDEGYASNRGFMIPDVHQALDYHEQDIKEAEALYDLLERYVLPLYAGTITNNELTWEDMMANSIAELGPRFSSARMVHEYNQRYYSSILNQ